MEKYDAIVIGSGNGGLSAATRLALNNKKVAVFEKHNIPGGCGTSFRRGRFEFEVALHQLSSMGTEEKPGDLRKLFKEYGILDKIKWIQIDSLFKVNLPGNKGVAIPADRKKAEELLCKTFPEEKENIIKYFKTCYDFSDQAVAFMAKASQSSANPSVLKKFIVKLGFAKMYPVLAKYGLKSTQEVMDEFFKSKELQLCLNAYWCFMGVPPEKFPFSILARCTVIYIEDKPFYVKGTSQMMSQALANRIIELGGDVFYNTGVREIIVEKGVAKGVILDNGQSVYSKYVISNISPLVTYGELIKKEEVPNETRKYFKNYKPGISALTLFIGLDCPPETVNFTDSFNLIYQSLDANGDFLNSYKLLPNNDPIICTNYTVDDPTVSPKGTSMITAGTLKYADEWMKLSPSEYYKKKYEAANIIIDRLEKKYPGIRDHIEEIEVATPLTHMRYLHHPNGAIYGFEQDIKSSVYFFPRKDFIKGLTFASGWVNTCGFGPNYLYGSQVATKVLKELK